MQGAVEPIVRFGCESWTLTVEDERRLNVAQMRWLRNIVGVTLRDRVRNEVVLNKCNSQKISTIIARHQLRYYGHVARMAPNRLVRQVRYWQPPGNWRRPRGRPKLRYLDGIRRHLNKIGIESFDEADAQAQDRVGWRQKIHTIK